MSESFEVKADAPAAAETPPEVQETPAVAPTEAAPEVLQGLTIAVPQEGADESAWNDVYNKLGRPETADAYGLSGVLAGAEMTPMDEAFLGNMSAVMHKAGLNTKQARDLTLACHEQFQALAESMDESYQKGLAEAREMYPPQTIEKAKRALEAVGLDKSARADIERALGPVRAIEIFSKASAALLPDTMPQGATGGSFTGSPEAARARADSLLADKNFCERYMRGDRDAVAQIENLYKQATAR